MPAPMYTMDKHDDIVIMTLTLNNFLHEDNERLMKSFDDMLSLGHKKIVLDLSETAYISSLILASLVYIHKKAKDEGGNLIMCNVKSRVQEILKMTNLDKVFDIVTDRSQAINKFLKK